MSGSLNKRRITGSVATFVPEPTDDQGVAIGRMPVVANDASMLTLAAGANAGWKTLDLGTYYYNYDKLLVAFSGLGATTLAEFEGMFADDAAGTTNPRPMNLLSATFNPRVLTTEIANGPSFSVTPMGRYFRYRIKNGATAQTALRVHLIALDHRG